MLLLLLLIATLSVGYVCPGSLVFALHLTVLGLLTLFKCTVTLPFASMVAVSPRNDTTLPRMRTVWLVKEPRYLALTRGVASDMVSEWSSRERIRKAVDLQRSGRQD